MATFGTLSDRLTETFRNLRTKGKLTPADVDGTVREIRRALLDADVAPVYCNRRYRGRPAPRSSRRVAFGRTAPG